MQPISMVSLGAGRPKTDDGTIAGAAAVTAAVLAGAHAVRVHDVAEIRKAVRVADAVRRGWPESADAAAGGGGLRA